MRSLNSENLKYVITLSASTTDDMEITVTYSVYSREKNSKRTIRGHHFTLGTTTETDLLPAVKNNEILRELERVTIYSPVTNATTTVTIELKDSFPATPVDYRVEKIALTADAFMRYSKELGWT